MGRGRGPWLAGETFSLADAALLPYVLRVDHLRLTGLLEGRPNLVGWYERVQGRESFRTAVADLLLVPMDRLKPQAERAEVNLILDLPGALPTVLADPTRIHQVVSNLLHNAIKFTPEGGEITLKAHINSAENEVVLSVHDTGVGIAKEDLGRIFERFYKSDRSRTRGRGGTGLGLAISRHIVEVHNGRIWVKSKEGKGSTFSFSLPISDLESTPVGQ